MAPKKYQTTALIIMPSLLPIHPSGESTSVLGFFKKSPPRLQLASLQELLIPKPAVGPGPRDLKSSHVQIIILPRGRPLLWTFTVPYGRVQIPSLLPIKCRALRGSRDSRLRFVRVTPPHSRSGAPPLPTRPTQAPGKHAARNGAPWGGTLPLPACGVRVWGRETHGMAGVVGLGDL